VKFTEKDEKILAEIFSDKNMDIDLLSSLLQGFSSGDDDEEKRDFLQAILSLQKYHRNFEQEHGVTIDEACMQLIEDGIYEPVLDCIEIMKPIINSFPPDSQMFLLLKGITRKFLDAMELRDRKGR
jgi:hypothetical protein